MKSIVYNTESMNQAINILCQMIVAQHSFPPTPDVDHAVAADIFGHLLTLGLSVPPQRKTPPYHSHTVLILQTPIATLLQLKRQLTKTLLR